MDDAARVSLEYRQEELGRQEWQAQQRCDRTRDAWENSRDTLDQLEKEEDALNARTANQLRDVDVGALEDPSWWDKLTDFIADFVKAIAVFAALGPLGLLALLPTEILQALYNALDTILVVLAVIVVVVLVVVLVAAILATGGIALPGLLGALAIAAPTLLGILGKIALIVSSAKLVLGVELYRRGEISVVDLLLDALDFALSGISVRFGVGFVLRIRQDALRLLAESLGPVVTIADYVSDMSGSGDSEDDGVPEGWTECSASVPIEPEGDGVSDVGDVENVTLPEVDVDIPNVSITLGPLSGMPGEWDIDISTEADFGFEGVNIDRFSLENFSFSELADFVYDNPEAVPDLSGLEMTEVAVDIDWHFEFEPPEILLGEFHQVFEEFKLLLVPCELET